MWGYSRALTIVNHCRNRMLTPKGNCDATTPHSSTPSERIRILDTGMPGPITPFLHTAMDQKQPNLLSASHSPCRPFHRPLKLDMLTCSSNTSYGALTEASTLRNNIHVATSLPRRPPDKLSCFFNPSAKLACRYQRQVWEAKSKSLPFRSFWRQPTC